MIPAKRVLLAVLPMAGCWRSSPPGSQEGSLFAHLGEGVSSLWPGESSQRPARGDARALPDEDDEPEVEDTGWLANLPVYECPPPPEDALVLDIGSNSSSVYAWRIPGTEAGGWRFRSTGISELLEGDACDPTHYNDVLTEYKTHYYISFTLAFPPACPLTYQGTPDAWISATDGSAIVEPALLSVFVWWEDEETRPNAGSNDTTTACLSRVRPDRISGTLTWYPADYDATTLPIHVNFDLSSRFPENDCLNTFYQDYLDDPFEGWHAWCPEGEGTDTGAGSG